MDLQDIPKDPNVMSFMMQLVQQKYGDEVEIDFLNQQAEQLYFKFGTELVKYFEPLLSEEQKMRFDSLIDSAADQNQILEFLMGSIPQLDVKIQQVLMQFRDDYLRTEV